MLLKKLAPTKPPRVLIVGDLVLDTYTVGQAERISPEAPVAVVHVQEEQRRPGMAGNVALNFLSLGAEVTIAGRIGDDSSGKQLREALETAGAHLSLSVQTDYVTPVKNRIIADNQQMVRIDREEIKSLSSELEETLAASLDALLSEVDVVAVSDYGKGFLSDRILKALIAEARRRSLPLVVDPKGLDFSKYQGATLVKPNLREAYAAASLPFTDSLDRVGEKLLYATEADALVITRAKEGISLFQEGKERRDFSVEQREVKDVTGAGDTVLAMLTYALGCGLSMEEAITSANIAAGVAIEHFGCTRVSLADVAGSLLRQDVENKLFDEEHLPALQQIMQHRPFTLLTFSGREGFTSPLFQAIRSLSRQGHDLILQITEPNPPEELLSLLISLNEVNFLLVDSQTTEPLRPEEHAVFDGEGVRSTSLEATPVVLA